MGALKLVNSKIIIPMTFTVFILGFFGPLNAFAFSEGFQGDFDPANWTFFTETDGSVDTSGAPDFIELNGGDADADDGDFSTKTDFTIVIPEDGRVAFDWDYFTEDGPFYDRAGFLINGVFVELTDRNGGTSQSGSASFDVKAGDVIGFRIDSTDDCCGRGSFTMIYNFLFFTPAEPGTIFGSVYQGPDGDSTLYTIDENTAVATPIGPIGFDRCGGIDFDSRGVLYGTCEIPDDAEEIDGLGPDDQVLVVIDPSTGAGHLVGPTGGHTFGSAISDISFRNSDDVLFAYLESNDGVGTIVKQTGALTELGSSGESCCGNGLAFSGDDTLYHANEDDLSTIDQGNGAATNIAEILYPDPPLSDFPRVNGMDFKPFTDTLFVSINDVSEGSGSGWYLGTLSTNPGEVDLIGQTVDRLDALAISPDKGMITEVHCEEIFLTWDLFEDLTTGIRGLGEPFECHYIYDSGLEESVFIVGADGDFTVSEITTCPEPSPIDRQVTGQIILIDQFGNKLTLDHTADLCFDDFFFTLVETPEGTGSVNTAESTGIFSGKGGSAETHRIITFFEECDDFDEIEILASEEPILSGASCGSIWVDFQPISTPTGGGDHEPPTIGKLSDGVVQAVVNGISIDGQSWTVTKDYHQEFELLQMLTSPHTISNEIYCNEGYQECDHITVAFLNIDSFFPDTVMTVSADKNHQGNWNISWSDPQNFIYDPDDPSEPKDITFTAQIIDNKRIGTSFTIDFRNKDTGQLKLGIQVRDMEGGVRNFYFNEGVMFNDADAYPAVMSSYDAPLEVESLCLNEDPDYRNSCAFAQKRAGELQKAQETLKQMQQNKYRYE